MKISASYRCLVVDAFGQRRRSIDAPTNCTGTVGNMQRIHSFRWCGPVFQEELQDKRNILALFTVMKSARKRCVTCRVVLIVNRLRITSHDVVCLVRHE